MKEETCKNRQVRLVKFRIVRTAELWGEQQSDCVPSAVIAISFGFLVHYTALINTKKQTKQKPPCKKPSEKNL